MSGRLKLGLFGLPGAGKGTQAERLSKFLTLPHVSTGDMFRALQSTNSNTAVQIREIISSGKLVPDELVTQMTFDRLEQSDVLKGFILDGYPRTLKQAVDLQESEHALLGLIEIRVPREEIIRRLSGRRVCSRCQATYHIDHLPAGGLCSLDQGDLVQRADDMPKAIEVRLDVFSANFSPLVRFYEERKLLHTIDGSSEPDMVFDRLMTIVDRIAQAA